MPRYAGQNGPAQPYAPPSYAASPHYSQPSGYAPSNYGASSNYPVPPTPTGHYGYQHQPPPSNGIAIAALVLSLVGIAAPCLLLVALPLGGVGLSKARKTGVGRGQALAGTIVASTLLLGWIVLISVVAAKSP